MPCSFVYVLYLLFILLIPINVVFATSSYELIVDDHIFNIDYDVDADVLAMAIDRETSSLLIGLDNTNDSNFIILLDNKIISAENNDFVVLVNGVDVDYELKVINNDISLQFFVPAYTEEIEIIGTHVIPEFPIGVIVLLVAMLTVITVASRFQIMSRL